MTDTNNAHMSAFVLAVQLHCASMPNWRMTDAGGKQPRLVSCFGQRLRKRALGGRLVKGNRH